MKRASLTQSQLEILENALLRYGNIVTTGELTSLISAKTADRKRQVVKQMADAGWLVRIKRGVYQISDLSSLEMLTLSRYTVAQLLVGESYVSFETALQYHGMYDQLPGTVTSISLKRHSIVTLEGIDYRFITTKEQYYFGWQEVQSDGRTAKVATPEKALIDLVQFHRTRLSVNLVAEKLAVYQDALDFDRLKSYLLCSNLATLRIFGVLLDKLGVDTEDLRAFSRRSTTVSRLTANSSLRDSRWQLMYDGEALTPVLNAAVLDKVIIED